jgi:hypothetical protein
MRTFSSENNYTLVCGDLYVYLRLASSQFCAAVFLSIGFAARHDSPMRVNGHFMVAAPYRWRSFQAAHERIFEAMDADKEGTLILEEMADYHARGR